MQIDQQEIRQIFKQCTRFLNHHYPRSPQQVLAELAATTDPELEMDRYGEGELINGFEREVAQMLGKEAAVFMPSGTMCQQIALRILTTRRHIPAVAFHPTCHLEIHEQQAYQRLHGLERVLLGTAQRPILLTDVQEVAEPVGALLLELPQREIGGWLPTWEELTAITNVARERGWALHLDGARLWECRPFYQRDYAEIAGLFDTVYVSFYKTLGGIAGALLAGPADIITEARIWQRRHGGNLISLYPYVLSARLGLQKHLSRMTEYRDKANTVALAISRLPQVECTPLPPQTNMAHVYLRGRLDKLQEAALALARETQTWIFSRLTPTNVPGYMKFEFVAGEATLDLEDEEIVELFKRLFELAD